MASSTLLEHRIIGWRMKCNLFDCFTVARLAGYVQEVLFRKLGALCARLKAVPRSLPVPSPLPRIK